MENEQRSFRRLDLSGALPGGLLQSIVINAVFPYMLYQFLVAHTSNLAAYLIVAIFPVLGIGYGLYQKRELDWIGFGALLLILFSCIESFVNGDSRIVLIRMAQPIALVGGTILFSLLFPRPLLFYIDRFFSAHNPRHAMQYKAAWENNRLYHTMIVVMNIVWGVGQLAIAATLALLFFTITEERFFSIATYLQVGVYALYIILVVWTIAYRGAQERNWLSTEEAPEDEEHHTSF